ncbi:MAG TPA: glycosyltransferase family 2 protein [Sedimentisphaerales bacterium]|nr:glycosyltransferase family 2 protein [Sedimentisphaerales bacterium]
MTSLKCSIIVPLYNEAEVVEELYLRLTSVMVKTGLSYELILIDDGSKDDTLKRLKKLAAKDEKLVVIEFRRNFGQTPALAAGFDASKGDIIITMDGDLQHAPEEIPEFLAKLNEGYDIVSGWRKNRVDNFVMRKIPSRIANLIASKISGVDIHDFGTTFKAYKRDVMTGVKLYGEMHRFIPALVAGYGVRIVEIPITNINRPSGTSNYGISRTFKVIFDLTTLRFVLGYISKPLHFFGKWALYCFAFSMIIFSYILYDKFVYNIPISVAHTPLAGLGTILLLVGFILISTGLIGEMISRVYFEATDRKIYSIRKVHTKETFLQRKK